jgi:outer membrane lipopolysaccharide assembly protein LptE/RlpB
VSSRRRLVIALVAVTSALTSCGATLRDGDKITAILKDVGQHPADLCTRFATALLLNQAGGMASCQRAAAAPDATDPNLKVVRVTVTGTTATARVQGRSGRNTIRLAKVGADWRISSAG